MVNQMNAFIKKQVGGYNAGEEKSFAASQTREEVGSQSANLNIATRSLKQP